MSKKDHTFASLSMTDKAIVTNLRFRWKAELAGFGDAHLASEYNDFALSDMYGDNDARFLEYLATVCHYNIAQPKSGPVRIKHKADNCYYFIAYNDEAQEMLQGWTEDIAKAFIYPNRTLALDALRYIIGDGKTISPEQRATIELQDASKVYVIKRKPIIGTADELIAWLGIKYRDEKPYRDWVNDANRVLRFETLELAQREASRYLGTPFTIDEASVDPLNKDYVRTPHDEMQIAWLRHSLWVAKLEREAGRKRISDGMFEFASSMASQWGWKQFPNLPYKIQDEEKSS